MLPIYSLIVQCYKRLRFIFFMPKVLTKSATFVCRRLCFCCDSLSKYGLSSARCFG